MPTLNLATVAFSCQLVFNTKQVFIMNWSKMTQELQGREGRERKREAGACICLLDTQLELCFFNRWIHEKAGKWQQWWSVNERFEVHHCPAEKGKIQRLLEPLDQLWHLSYDLLVMECSFTWAYEDKVSERARTHMHMHTHTTHTHTLKSTHTH